MTGSSKLPYKEGVIFPTFQMKESGLRVVKTLIEMQNQFCLT